MINHPSGTSALYRLGVALGNLASITQKTVVSDHFSSFSEENWGPTDFEDSCGTPQETTICQIDDRCVLRMRSNISTNERRGFSSTRTFLPPKIRVEVDFKPLSGINGLMELWLTDRQGWNYVGIGVYGANLGLSREVASYCSIEEPAIAAYNCWDYGRWYRLAIEGDQRRTSVALRTADDSDVWAHTYPWTLADLGSCFRVNLTQCMNESRAGIWKAESAIDRVSISACPARVPAMTPVSAR